MIQELLYLTINSTIKQKIYYYVYMKNLFKTNTNKTILSRIWLGLKLSWSLPSLPVSVNQFHNYPIVRILRVIGGISIILFLSSPNWIGDSYLYWIIFVFAMLQFLYIICISFIKIGYIVYLWKNKKLEVRNSPLDHLASLTLSCLC